MSSNGKTESRTQAAERLQQPELHWNGILIPAQAKARGRREHPHDSLARPIRPADGRSAETDADVVAHDLDSFVGGIIDPRQSLKFWIERGPFFQRLWLAESHRDRLVKIRSARIRRVDVGMEFRRRKTPLDITQHFERLPAIFFGFTGKGEDQRERAGDACARQLFRNIVKDVCSLEANLVHRSENIVRTGFRSNEYSFEAAAAHELHILIGCSEKKVGCRLNAPVELFAGLDDPICDIDPPLTIDKKVVVDDV